MLSPGRGRPHIAIIGSGFSGLCLAIQLKKAGIDSFTIFEKSERLGGTWRDNTYPGAACDVPSFLYCFSFEQKTDWSRKWSPHDEIQAYMTMCARKYDIERHMRFNTEIAAAHFDAEAGVWHLRTTTGEEIAAHVLVSAVGQLNRPYLPKIDGLDRFGGTVFHSARWDHGYDLAGKTAGGRITNNWPGSTLRYWWTTRRFDAECYQARRRENQPVSAVRSPPAAQAVDSAA